MAISEQYKEFVIDLFSPLGAIKVRSMFGGGGVYYKDTMFALISNETLFLKVDETNKAAFKEEGAGPFVYDGKGKPIAMSYYELPERLFDDTDELMQWAQRSIDVALKSKKPKRNTARKKRA